MSIFSDNIIRRLSNYIRPHLKKVFGYYYVLAHTLILATGGFVLLFSNNVFYLTILLLIVSLDAFAIVVLHDCPLTILEKKYLKHSIKKEHNKIYKKYNILHKCNHLYESQIEYATNIWVMVSCKILCILFMQTSRQFSRF